MPNIELYGFEWRVYEMRLKPLIDKVMQSLSLGNDPITTFWTNRTCVTESCDGTKRQMPYIRICGTDIDEIKRIKTALQAADIKVDCEILLLTEFIPRDEMVRPKPT
jgi:hypothetical protein